MNDISIERQTVTVESDSKFVQEPSRQSIRRDAQAEAQTGHVPALRSDLILQPVTVDSRGTPYWTLTDALRTRYFKLGWIEYELLSRWHLEQSEKIVASVNNDTTLSVSTADLTRLIEFLEHSELLVADRRSTLNSLLNKSEKKNHALWRRGFRSTMFVRKNLFNPDQLLEVLLVIFSPIFMRWKLFLGLWGVGAVVSAYGVSAHAYEFKDAFATFMTPSGFVLFGLTLIALNVIHELGHGVVAKWFGCRVSEFGVALIFMLPVAYCDTSDAWRLISRKKRLLINCGGIAAEMLVAIVALLFWLVLPDGIPRTVAYFAAITSVVSTLVINLNPCLKFDGYYLLSDWLGIENLQKKSFDLGRWQWRKRILGELEDIPHAVTRRDLRTLHRYANFTWVYRLFLYLTICAMVYTFWFKALGIVLMVGVCVALLIKPLASELLHYLRTIISGRVSRVRLSSIFTLLVFSSVLFIPLPRNISVPAVISADASGRVFNHAAGLVENIHVQVGEQVQAGDILIKLRVPELEYRQAILLLEIKQLQRQLNRETEWKNDKGFSQVSATHVLSKQAELEKVIQEQEMLSLRAPFDAVIVTVPEWLTAGTWVSANTILAEVVSTTTPEIRAYLPANKITYIDQANPTFETLTGERFNELTLKSVSTANIDVLSDRMLSTQLGGHIATRQLNNGELSPVQGWHQLTLVPKETSAWPDQELAGFARINTEPLSFASSAFRRIYGVVLRESGF